MKNFYKTSNIWLFFAFVLYLSVLFGCNERPTEISYHLLLDTTNVVPLSSDSVNFFHGASTKFVFTKIFNTGAIFIGRFGDYRSASLIRFKEINLPDTLLWLTEEHIDSVRLVLPFSRYTFGDSLNPNFGFKVYLINEYWTNAITWDSIFSDWTPNSKVHPVPIGNFYGKIPIQDTNRNISIELSKSFILDWLRKNKDSIPIWGILLAPEPSCNVIHQISAQYVTDKEIKHPEIVVKYRNIQGQNRIWYISSAIDASVVQVPPVDTSSSLVIQSGYSYRTSIKFDLTSLPYFSAIHLAKLELTIDRSKSVFGNFGLDSVFSGGYFATAPLDSVPLISFYGRREGDKVVFYKVSSPLEIWLKETRSGELIFYSYFWNEVRSLDRIVFYGFDTPELDKRPKLKLIYSKRFEK
ncbi:MAG: hypothetical protein N2517_09215 [Ignavibacteria bacterium]|nr:hypothetical protein [Ignavibacteria bacterium]